MGMRARGGEGDAVSTDAMWISCVLPVYVKDRRPETR
jgi:hypothetical protein